MRRAKAAEQVLEGLICSIKVSLSELSLNGNVEGDFACGQIYAYIECLEFVQLWEGAKKFGLSDNLEKEYHLI